MTHQSETMDGSRLQRCVKRNFGEGEDGVLFGRAAL
jgi:hypothetical protein